MTQAWPACLLHNERINTGEVNMTTLFDSAPGFDQPLAVLKHCHDRIRKQLATMSKLLEHLPSHGADQDARQAAQAILNYFTKAAPFHHEDEEINLLPELQVTAKDEDAALLASLLPKILSQHEEMAAQWQELEKQLNAIVRADDGAPASLSAPAVHLFNDLYTDHMQTEETQIAPMAKRLFSEAQMAVLGAAMQARRGIAA